MALAVAYLAATLLVYALLARRLRTTALTSAIFFAGLGLLAGDMGLGIMTAPTNSEPVKLVLEITLAVVLFADAAATSSTSLLRERFLPLRLLVIGLPCRSSRAGASRSCCSRGSRSGRPRSPERSSHRPTRRSARRWSRTRGSRRWCGTA